MGIKTLLDRGMKDKKLRIGKSNGLFETCPTVSKVSMYFKVTNYLRYIGVTSSLTAGIS